MGTPKWQRILNGDRRVPSFLLRRRRKEPLRLPKTAVQVWRERLSANEVKVQLAIRRARVGTEDDQ